LVRQYGSASFPALSTFTKNQKLINWVEEQKNLLGPDNVRVMTGTDEENKELCDLLVSKGVMEQLNPKLRPNSFLARTDPADVARLISFSILFNFIQFYFELFEK